MAKTPTLPLTYTDGVCFDDVDGFGRETTSDLENLVQDVFHILDEDPGSNPDDINRGIGVYGMLSGSSVDLAKVASRVDRELAKDDRIDSSKTTIAVTAGQPNAYTMNLRIVVDGTVVGLSFAFDAVNGLSFNSWIVLQ